MSQHDLPPTHKALIQNVYAEPLVVSSIPTPQPTPGSVVIRVLFAPVMSYLQEVYNGKRSYRYPTPLVTGTSAVGRVAATGPDTVRLKKGELVYFDCFVRGRDDAEAQILMGIAEGASDASRKLIHGEWRDATFAEYAKVPLENVYAMDEKRICGDIEAGGLGYRPEQLTWLFAALVPFGGLRSIGLQPGETIIIAPATGGFGSAGVVVALAMGATVIAMGRNAKALEELRVLGPRVKTVQMTGDLDAEMSALKEFGRIDAFLDISPRFAQQSTHFKAAILALRPGGRVSFMGGLLEDLAIPYRFIMRHGITIKGKWMCDRADNFALLDMITTGVLDFRSVVDILGVFKLEEWETAFELSMNNGRLGDTVVLAP